jgi:flagellar basal-body rod protein FlgF
VDNLIYVAMSGIRQAETVQTVLSNNLANVSTVGFRAERPVFDSIDILGDGLESRVNSVLVESDWDASGGAMMQTGEALDVAIHGQGWFTVQGPDGEEAYTRAGRFRLSTTGMLETDRGQLVLGEGGPISLPDHQEIRVGSDGQISIIPLGQQASTLVEVDRLKLVNPDNAEMARSPDGLFRSINGDAFVSDPSIRVVSGELESSNVNVTEALVQMIEMQRHFETQVRALRLAEQNDEAAASLMQMTG